MNIENKINVDEFDGYQRRTDYPPSPKIEPKPGQMAPMKLPRKPATIIAPFPLKK